MVPRNTLPITIASGQSLSGACDTLGCDVIALAFPAGWDAAAVTFQTSDDGVTYRNVYDSAAEVSYAAAAADRWVMVNTSHLAMLGRFLKVRSGTSGAAVNQTADRLLKVITRTVV